MNLIAEISMYPLQDGYIEAIDAFLAELNVQNAVEVRTDRMSTQLYGGCVLGCYDLELRDEVAVVTLVQTVIGHHGQGRTRRRTAS